MMTQITSRAGGRVRRFSPVWATLLFAGCMTLAPRSQDSLPFEDAGAELGTPVETRREVHSLPRTDAGGGPAGTALPGPVAGAVQPPALPLPPTNSGPRGIVGMDPEDGTPDPLSIPAPIRKRQAEPDATSPLPAGVQRRLDLTVQAPARKQVDSNVTYRLTVQNRGDDPAEEVSVHCEFDQPLIFSGSSDREVLNRIGRMLPNETRELALSLMSHKTGTHCSRFTVRFKDQEQEVEALWKSVCVEFVPRQLEISVQGPSQRTVGSRAEFNLFVSNRSKAPLSDVRVAVAFDAALIPKEATAGAEQKPRSLAWNLETLQPAEGVQLQIEFECQIPARRACLTVEAGAKELSGDQAERCVEIVPIPGVLDLRVSDRVDPIEVGKRADYEVSVQNIGLQVVRKVRLETEAPSQLKALSAKVVQDGQPLDLKFERQGQRLIFEPIEQLGPDARVVFLIEVEGLQAGKGEFTATLTSSLSRAAVSVSEPTGVTEP